MECWHSRDRKMEVTHTESKIFEYASCCDLSAPAYATLDLDKFNLTMLKVQKKFVFSNNASAAEYERQKSHFIVANSKDKENTFSEILTIPGYKEYMLCDDKARSPRCYVIIFILLHSLCLGPCYRRWFHSKYSIRTVDIVKELSVEVDTSI